MPIPSRKEYDNWIRNKRSLFRGQEWIHKQTGVVAFLYSDIEDYGSYYVYTLKIDLAFPVFTKKKPITIRQKEFLKYKYVKKKVLNRWKAETKRNLSNYLKRFMAKSNNWSITKFKQKKKRCS